MVAVFIDRTRPPTMQAIITWASPLPTSSLNAWV